MYKSLLQSICSCRQGRNLWKKCFLAGVWFTCHRHRRAPPRPATDGLRVPSDISTLSSSATMMTNDANHAKLTDPYLYGLSELQVEGNDTHTLQPGGEPGPRTPAGPAVRRLLMSGRTGAVERVHHDRIRAPRPPSSILRPSITITLPTPSERRLTGRWSPLLDPSGTNTSGTDPSGTDTSGTDITDTHQLSLFFYFSKTRCKTVPCASGHSHVVLY